MKKFTKIITFTAIIGAAAAGIYTMYKKYKEEKDFENDDFDEFDDFEDLDDDFNSMDEESRGYTSIIPEESDSEEEFEDLTEEEKVALSDAASSIGSDSVSE